MDVKVQRFIDQIVKEAKQNAKTILQEAHDAANLAIEKERERAIKESQSEIRSILKRGEEEVEAIKRAIIAEAKQKASWLVLSEKERLVTSIIDEVKTQLRTFSQSRKYASVLQRLIVDAGVTLGDDKLEIILREQDSKLPLKLPRLAKLIEEKTGTATKLEISKERIQSIGGCVIRTGDRRIMIDNTFPAILKRNERTLKNEITKLLFNHAS